MINVNFFKILIINLHFIDIFYTFIDVIGILIIY